MATSIDSLTRSVRIALDQNMVSDQLFQTGDVDTLSLDELIKEKIPTAARIVEQNAAYYWLGDGDTFSSTTITWDSQAGYGPGSIALPDDFLRLVCFKMSDWDHPVFVPILETDPLYAVQRSRFGGVRGNPQKPVVAIVHKNEGLALEFYSSAADSNASVATARYIKMPVVANNEINICDKLYDAIVYYTAFLVASVVGEKDKAASLRETSNSLMQ